MIAGTRRTATSTPFRSPRTRPSRTPRRIATGAPTVCEARMSATANATRPIVASTDRSTLRVRMTIASPTAATAMIEAWAVTWVRFDADRNCGACVNTNAPSTTMTTTRLSSRWRATARSRRAADEEPDGTATGTVASAIGRSGGRRLGRGRTGLRCLAGRREHHGFLGRVVARALGRDPALVHHEDPIRHRQDFGQVAGDEDDP